MAFDMESTKRSAKSAARKTLITGLILAAIALAGYYVYRTWTVSEGSRTGLLFKASKKGVVFKTYEAQLHLGGSAMMTDQSVWNFSISEPGVFDSIQKMEGKTVRCYYKELIDPFPWQGETKYLVYKIETME